jgi:hypothetical protein
MAGDLQLVQGPLGGVSAGDHMKELMALMMAALLVLLPQAIAVQIAPESVQSKDITESEARISWTTNVLADGKVEHGLSIGNMLMVPETGGAKTDHEVLLSGLSAGTRYYYRAVSQDATSLTSSDYYQFTTLLLAPTSLKQSTVTHNSAQIQWQANTKAVKYRIYQNSQNIGESTSDQYTATGLTPSTAYQFQVTALDSFDRESQKSAVLTVSTTAQPANLSFIQVSNLTMSSATVGWTTGDSVACTISYGKETTLGLVKTESSATTAHNVVLAGLDRDTRYYFKVKCRDTESSQQTFQTLKNETSVQLSNIKVTEVTAHTAKIAWQSGVASTGTLRYGMDDTFSQAAQDPTVGTTHIVSLSGLSAGATYYYKVLSAGMESAYSSFKTVDSITDFLKLGATPVMTSNRTFVVSGDTRPNARVYIFVNGKDPAQARQTINGTHFAMSVNLDPSVRTNGATGLNVVKVVSWDAAGNQDVKSFQILLDATPPALTISELPDVSRDARILVTGTTEPNATVEFIMNGRGQGPQPVGANGTFASYMNMGSDGNYTVSVVAKDSAGNTYSVTKKMLVDRTAPKLEFLTDFAGETHFKLFKIKGKTEPGAKVSVVNFGKYNGCEDIDLKTKFGGCDKFVQNTDKYDKFTGVIDPLTYALGMEQETTADDQGFFTVSVSLIPVDGLQASKNTLVFTATDAAGNKNQIAKTIMYKTGCFDWQLGTVESFPFNIYTRELYYNSVEASSFFPITYIGPGTPNVSAVEIGKDNSNHGYLMADDDAMSELIEVSRVGAKASAYDVEKRQLFVYAPITVKQYRGSVKKLPDQLNAWLYVRVTYRVENGTSTCDLYPVIAFDVQKPVVISKWLSPTMINQSIKNLDNMINVTKKLANNVQKATKYTMIACGALIAYNYVSGFFGAAEKKEPGQQCTSTEEQMYWTYQVCDRLLCPAAPPRCENFNAPDNAKYSQCGADGLGADGNCKTPGTDLDATKYQEYADNNYKLRQAYIEAKKKDSKLTWDSFKADPASYGSTGLQPYQPVQGPTDYSYKSKDERGSDQTTRVKLLQVDKNGKLADQTYAPPLRDSNGKVIFDPLLKQAQACSGGTLLETYTVGEGPYTGPVGTVQAGTVITTPEYRCLQNMAPGDIGKPNSASWIKGCYNAQCPKYDNTKCFDADNINPPTALWSSGKCACLPGLLAHLQNWIKVMEGMKKCLEQALIGEVRGGYCERLISQFVCDLLIEAFKLFLSFAPSDTQNQSADTSGIYGSLGKFKQSSASVSQGLSDRYSDIAKNKMGLSSDEIVNKACVVAFTGDWSLLDGVLDGIVQTIEVEPTPYLEAESRPYGYDPFSGRMNIGYNVYVGVVAGGETDISVWLECDKAYSGGQFCGQEADRKLIPRAQKHMSKSSPPWNENILFNDNNAKYWYNKAVMQLKYKVGGKDKTMTIQKQIWRKGDLAVSCDFSETGGIECKGITELLPSGGVELYSATQGSHLSPPGVSMYRDGDSISALIIMKNSFKKPFYLIAQYPNSNTPIRQYTIQPPSSGNNQGVQYYNLWLASVSDLGAASVASTDFNWPAVSINKPLTKDTDFALKIDEGQLESMDVVIQPVVKDKGNGKTFTCKVYAQGMKLDDKAAKGWYSANEFTYDPAAAAGGQFKDRMSSDGYYSCIMGSYDSFKLDDGFTYTMADITGINSVTFTRPVFKLQRQQDFQKMNVLFKGIDGFTTTELINKKAGTSQNSRTIKVNVYQDTNDNNQGDTPISFSGGKGDQTIEWSYSVGTPSDLKPKADLIEPIGQYFNNDGNTVPIGFNLWNTKQANVKVVDRSGAIKWESDSCNGDRTTINTPNAPPFVECDMPADKFTAKGSTDIYDIIITPKPKEGSILQGDPVRKSLVFDPSKKLTREDVMVCLGGGTCSAKFTDPTGNTEPLGNQAGNTAPVVRTR